MKTPATSPNPTRNPLPATNAGTERRLATADRRLATQERRHLERVQDDDNPRRNPDRSGRRATDLATDLATA